MKRYTCIIVVPCYNEANRLPEESFRQFAAANSDIGFILVDDGSTDGTVHLLERLQSEFPDSMMLLAKPVNEGKAEAVRDGMNLALTSGTAPIIGFWDADCATPLQAIRELLADLKRPEIEFVFGARVKLLGWSIERRPIRHYLGRVFASAVSIILRFPIYDTQCGAKLFRVTSFLPLLLANPFLSKWVFDVELIARYIQLKGGEVRAVARVIYEHPLSEWRDIAGSKVRPWDFLRAISETFAIYRTYLISPRLRRHSSSFKSPCPTVRIQVYNHKPERAGPASPPLGATVAGLLSAVRTRSHN